MELDINIKFHGITWNSVESAHTEKKFRGIPWNFRSSVELGSITKFHEVDGHIISCNDDINVPLYNLLDMLLEHIPCMFTVSTRYMESEDWGALYIDGADWYTNFIITVKNKLNACFPLVWVSRKRLKDKPWLTHSLKTCIRKKHKLYKITMRNGNVENICKYKQYRNILVKSLKTAEELYYKQLFDDTQQSAYNLWKHLRPIINQNTKKSRSGIYKILYNGEYITDKAHICNAMNEYFCEVGKKLQEKMPDCGGEFLNYLPAQITETFFLSPVVKEELISAINKLNPRTSCGSDDIGAKVIQLCPMIFADNLAKIYNHSIEICDYPSELKIAKVIALFKKGEKSNPNNYRPISLLSCFNKLFEKLLCKRLVKVIERNQILFNYQYGFRKLHSTTLALIEFTDNIIRYLDEGNYCISVFIDLKKAFDTVDHEILLHKLERYGIRGHANMFIRSYLNNRHQYTTMSDSSSTLRKVHCGVPQGSVLGPLLFALYINDIQYAVGAECVRLFADDTALYMFNTDLTVLISNVKVKIQQMFQWCICNKLTINSDKTYFVLFHTVNKPVPNDLIDIVTPQMTIKRATEMKYLGLLLDEKLNYNEHVQSICNSLLKYFGIFNHIKHKVNKKTARQLYFAFVFSRIKYGIEIYGNCSERNMNKIQTMQNKLLKLLLQLDRLTPTSILHKNLNILKINDLYKCSVLSFVNDTQIGKCPKIFEKYFQKKRNNYDLRRKDQLDIPPARLTLGDRAVRIKGAKLWNDIHKDLKIYKCKMTFRKHLMKWHITKYNP